MVYDIFTKFRNLTQVIFSDVILESVNVLESDSSPYFENSDLDSDPEDSDSNVPMTLTWTQSFQGFDSAL